MTSQLLTNQSPLPVSNGEDDMRQYLSEIHQYPRLSPEQELELAKRCAQGDENAIRQMVNSNLRLVVSVARDYAGRGVPLMDLIQEGSIGLLVAAKKFDYTMDFRFSTYATKWIRQGVTKCLSNHGIIRVPAHTGDKIRKLMHIRGEWILQNGAEPSTSELAQVSGISPERVQQLLQLNPEVFSLDAPSGEDEGPLQVLLEDLKVPQPYETLIQQELNHAMELLMSELNERQRLVVQMHFGMVDGTCYSLDEIGKKLGISKERARQIEKQAMEKMQRQSSGMGLEDFLE